MLDAAVLATAVVVAAAGGTGGRRLRGQELVDNRAGCFEWFGLDFMVDRGLGVWNLECNISPDLSRGTEVPAAIPRPPPPHPPRIRPIRFPTRVHQSPSTPRVRRRLGNGRDPGPRAAQVLDRLVPAAMHGLWRMLLLGPAARDGEARDPEHGWDLVYRGKEIRRDALVKRCPPPHPPRPGPAPLPSAVRAPPGCSHRSPPSSSVLPSPCSPSLWRLEGAVRGWPAGPGAARGAVAAELAVVAAATPRAPAEAGFVVAGIAAFPSPARPVGHACDGPRLGGPGAGGAVG